MALNLSFGTIAALRALPPHMERKALCPTLRCEALGTRCPSEYRPRIVSSAGSWSGAVSPADLWRIFEKFRPWRAYAAIHLWASTQKARVLIPPGFTGGSKALVGALTAGARISRVRNTPS